jgi:predicted flap endonuclease-1-like 5' DNA nuclease
MPNYRLKELEGIGPVHSKTMDGVDVRNVNELLRRGATPKGREELAKQTGIGGAVILKWVNMADLFRVKGIGKQYSELLEKAGVDTVKELRTRRADNLTATLAQANEAGGRRLVRQLPGLKRVQGWITEAQKLPPAVFY